MKTMRVWAHILEDGGKLRWFSAGWSKDKDIAEKIANTLREDTRYTQVFVVPLDIPTPEEAVKGVEE